MRALALTLCVTLWSCAFGVKHPAITAAIVGSAVGLGGCEIGTDFESNGTCAIVGASAGAALGAVVAIAVLLGGDGHTVLMEEPMTEPPPPLVREKKTPAPPVVPAAPTEARCRQLFDHLIDLELAKAAPGQVTAEQRAAIVDAKSAEFLDTCTHKTPAAKVECALAAPDLDAVTRCDDAPAPKPAPDATP